MQTGSNLMKRRQKFSSWLFAGAAVVAGCSSDDEATQPKPSEPVPITFPRATAASSRHDALFAALRDESRGLSFEGGDWLEDYGDAPYYGMVDSHHMGDTARRDGAIQRAHSIMTLGILEGDVQEMTMSGLGLIELMAERHDGADLPLVDDFIDRLGRLVESLGLYLDLGGNLSWALKTYGPTSISALVGLVHAQYALFIDSPRAAERLQYARDMDEAITTRAFGTLPAANGSGTVQAYRFGKERDGLFLYPNVAMMLLKARLFRLTLEPHYLQEATALWNAVQSLRLDAPGRFYSGYNANEMGATTRDFSSLSEHNYLALALLILFEESGEPRFVDEADRVLDTIEHMRGPWCLSQVDVDRTACGNTCAAPQVCTGTTCVADHCQEGVLHHIIDGRLAAPSDPSFFCSGCNLQSLYVLGLRRSLAGQGW